MNTYRIYYSALVCGSVSIEAKSRTDAFRQFDLVSDSQIFNHYDEILEADIVSIVRDD